MSIKQEQLIRGANRRQRGKEGVMEEYIVCMDENVIMKPIKKLQIFQIGK
jgi:hypothetical protein